MRGYTVQVTNLSPDATEREIRDFFSFSGEIVNIQIDKFEDDDSTAYVTFRESRGLETACMLTGSVIAGQVVYIDSWNHGGDSDEELDYENMSMREDRLSITPGQAVTRTQEVVKTMISLGYVVSKDAIVKAKAFDEAHGLTAAAAAKVAELSKRVGITDRITSSMETMRSIDEQFYLSETATTVACAATSVACATARTAAAVGSSIVNSSYFASGALLVSNALHKAAGYAADLGHRTDKN